MFLFFRFLRASAAVSSISKSSVVISADFCQDSNPRLLEFEDKTSSDKSFLLYLLLNQGRRRQRRRKNSTKFLEPSSLSTTVSSIKSTCEFNYKSAGYSTLCVLQYFCSDYLVYKKERSKKQWRPTKPIKLASVQKQINTRIRTPDLLWQEAISNEPIVHRKNVWYDWLRSSNQLSLSV